MRAPKLPRLVLGSCHKQIPTGFASSSLLPFLYETSTIRSISVSSPLAAAAGQRSQRAQNSDRVSGGHVPFENVQRHPKRGKESPTANDDGSSLSATEREAFAKLFGKLGTPNIPQDALSNENDGQQPRRVSRNIPRIDPEQRDAHLAQLPSSIRTLAEAALERFNGTPAASKVYQDGNEDRTEGAQADVPSDEDADDVELEKYLDSIEALLNAEGSDIAAWGVLQREMFEPLKLLDLDGDQGQHDEGKQSKQRKPQDSAKASANASPEMVLAAVPHVAMLAVDNIHRRFPASQLPLSILPQLKHISKTAHALAVSPDLYASILLIDWARFSSPFNTISMLREMEAEGVELDREVLASLSTIVQEAQAMRSGAHGPAVKLICGMEGWADKADELANEWVPLARQRIMDAAVKQVHEQEEQLLRASEDGLGAGAIQHGTSEVRRAHEIEGEFGPDERALASSLDR